MALAITFPRSNPHGVTLLGSDDKIHPPISSAPIEIGAIARFHSIESGNQPTEVSIQEAEEANKAANGVQGLQDVISTLTREELDCDSSVGFALAECANRQNHFHPDGKDQPPTTALQAVSAMGTSCSRMEERENCADDDCCDTKTEGVKVVADKTPPKSRQQGSRHEEKQGEEEEDDGYSDDNYDDEFDEDDGDRRGGENEESTERQQHAEDRLDAAKRASSSSAAVTKKNAVNQKEESEEGRHEATGIVQRDAGGRNITVNVPEAGDSRRDDLELAEESKCSTNHSRAAGGVGAFTISEIPLYLSGGRKVRTRLRFFRVSSRAANHYQGLARSTLTRRELPRRDLRYFQGTPCLPPRR